MHKDVLPTNAEKKKNKRSTVKTMKTLGLLHLGGGTQCRSASQTGDAGEDILPAEATPSPWSLPSSAPGNRRRSQWARAGNIATFRDLTDGDQVNQRCVNNFGERLKIADGSVNKVLHSRF